MLPANRPGSHCKLSRQADRARLELGTVVVSGRELSGGA